MLAVEFPLVRAALRRVDDEAEAAASPSAALAALAAAKARVPVVRAAVGPRRWQAAVAGPPPPTEVAVASRAYHKMREIWRSCALPVPERSLHLCEAPGGFVQAVADGVDEAEASGAVWSWVATSLGAPHPEPAWALLPMARGTFHWGHDVFADDDEVVPAGAFDLVTADGAVEMDHADLEAAHWPLLWAQTRAALRALRVGGTLVIKCFEVGDARTTQRWVAWLTTRFRRVSLIKPRTSRATNSERYLVARHLEEAVAADEDDPTRWEASATWRAELQRVVDRMAEEQCRALHTAFARLGVAA
jgi:23S rRNA U2552 (ribose-2'-O)-methylase RlmE/FtsJ